jgi:hypothetical protein
VPLLLAARQVVGGDAVAVAVIDAARVDAHHPAQAAAAGLVPQHLVLGVDQRHAAVGIGDGQQARPDVQPQDVHVRGALVGQARGLAGQVVNVAVVAAGVDPALVADDALDPLGQLELHVDLPLVIEGEDPTILVADPAAAAVHEDAQGRRAAVELPQDRRLPGRRPRAGDGPPRDGPLLAHAGHRPLVTLAGLLLDLLGGLGLRLGGVGEAFGRRLPLVADPAEADGQDVVLDRDLVELVRDFALFGQLQISLFLGAHGVLADGRCGMFSGRRARLRPHGEPGCVRTASPVASTRRARLRPHGEPGCVRAGRTSWGAQTPGADATGLASRLCGHAPDGRWGCSVVLERDRGRIVAHVWGAIQRRSGAIPQNFG